MKSKFVVVVRLGILPQIESAWRREQGEWPELCLRLGYSYWCRPSSLLVCLCSRLRDGRFHGVAGETLLHHLRTLLS